MTTIARLTGILLLILVGYHYINHPLGFNVSSSIATGIFGICLTTVYRTYEADHRIWIGWALIASGCLILASFTAFNLLFLVPSLLIVLGYRLAELPFDLSGLGGNGSGGDSGGGFGDSCGGGDSGGCGD